MIGRPLPVAPVPAVADLESAGADRLTQLSRRGGARIAGFACTILIVAGLLITAVVLNDDHSTVASTGTDLSQAGVYYSNSTSRSTRTTSTSTGADDFSTTTGDPESRLRSIATADLPDLRASVVGAWVPQLSSKRPGLVADGMTYDHAAILADHLRLRSSYPGTKLVWSGEWVSFKSPDYWVTVSAGNRFTTAQAANAWCDQQGFDKDSCYAKRLMTTGGYDGNTKPR